MPDPYFGTQDGPTSPYGFGNTDPTSDARRAAAGPINYQIDTSGLQVQPDINGSYSGMVNFGGVPTKINVTGEGQIFDETGRNITSRFNPQDLQTLTQSFQQASGDQTFQPAQAAQQVNTQQQPQQSPASGPSAPSAPSSPTAPGAGPDRVAREAAHGGGYRPVDDDGAHPASARCGAGAPPA